MDNTFYSEFVRDMFKNGPEGAEDRLMYMGCYGQLHAAVGLAGEAGEVLDILKKQVFTGKVQDKIVIIKEMGDVEFYLQALRNELCITRDEILGANVTKLNERHPGGFKESTYYEK